jgi:CheY-like chemotaxis protein
VGIVDLMVLSLFAGLFLYLKKTINHKLVGAIGTLATGLFYFFLVAYDGVSKTAYVWAFTYPLIAVYLLGKKQGSIFSILLLAMAGIVFALGSRVDFFTTYQTDLIIRFVPAYMIIFLFAIVMEKVRETILVVDDVEEQRTIASKLLKHLGYAVETVSSGEEAMVYMDSNTADLVVLDMIMPPGMDGLETYKKLIAIHPEQKAIIASGFSETDRVKKAQQLGAGKYVKKPYTVE